MPSVKKLIIIFICLILLGSCKKQGELFKELRCTVALMGYACGLACDALTYIIKIDGQDTYYVPENLPAAFRINGLSIKVRFSRTGRFPAEFQGPDYEIINIIAINPE